MLCAIHVHGFFLQKKGTCLKMWVFFFQTVSPPALARRTTTAASKSTCSRPAARERSAPTWRGGTGCRPLTWRWRSGERGMRFKLSVCVLWTIFLQTIFLIKNLQASSKSYICLQQFFFYKKEKKSTSELIIVFFLVPYIPIPGTAWARACGPPSGSQPTGEWWESFSQF